MSLIGRLTRINTDKIIKPRSLPAVCVAGPEGTKKTLVIAAGFCIITAAYREGSAIDFGRLRMVPRQNAKVFTLEGAEFERVVLGVLGLLVGISKGKNMSRKHTMDYIQDKGLYKSVMFARKIW